MRCGKAILFGLILGSLSQTVVAQTPVSPIHEGDNVLGVGELRTVAPAVVNDRGMWVGQITAGPDRTPVLLRNGFVTLYAEAPLAAPAGASVKDIQRVWMNNDGDLALVLDLNGVGQDNVGLYWNATLLAQKNKSVTAPEVTEATWTSFDAVQLNDDNTLLMLARMRRPGSSNQGDGAVVRIQLDPLGNVLSQNVLIIKGEFLPALGELVSGLSTFGHSLSMNSAGDYLTMVTGLITTTSAYIINGETIVAQEGFPTPLAGHKYFELSLLPKLSMNDSLDYVFHCSIRDDAELAPPLFAIIRNDEIFIKEGDPLAAVAPYNVGKPAGGSWPIYIANSGDVFWQVQASDPNANINAFMRNFEVILQENRSTIDGVLVTQLDTPEGAFHVSRDGRFFVGQIELQVIGEAYVLVDLGLVLPIPGCTGNDGELSLFDGRPLPGDRFRLAMDGGQASGVTPIVVFATRPALPGSECGIPSPFGEILINPASKLGIAFGPVWLGAPSLVSLTLPDSLALVDAVFFAQGYFWDVGNQSPAEDFRLTNALRIEIGAP